MKETRTHFNLTFHHKFRHLVLSANYGIIEETQLNRDDSVTAAEFVVWPASSPPLAYFTLFNI